MILSVSVLAVMIGVVAGYSPNRLWSTNRYPYNVPYDQSFQEGYSLLKHTGSYGPYSNRASYGIGRDPPAGCAVDQVMMLRRHGERFPQASAGKAMMDVVQQMYKNKTGGGAWTDDLEFLNRWQFFVPEQGYFELESFMGPYAGLLESYRHGAEYRTRYGHLWDQSPGKRVPIFVADMERVTQTARKFGEGFFAWNYTTSAAINIISESGKMGANSLTPRCQSNSTGNSVCANLTNYHPQFDIAAARLNGMSPGLKLSWIDIFALMEMSAFELNVRGYSDWANVFTLDEWVAFGYQNDLDFYYCNGPGNADNKAVGGVYINATLTLMNQGPEKAGTLFFSFSHDTNITPVLAALGIPYVEKDLPTDRIAFPNPYTISDIMPMGGHLTIERLACNATAAAPKDTYVRLVLNEAVVPFGACQDGPGYSCSLGNYTRLVQAMLLDYVSTCNVPASQPQYLKFFWEYSNSTDWNYQRGEYIPWQGSSDV